MRRRVIVFALLSAQACVLDWPAASGDLPDASDGAKGGEAAEDVKVDGSEVGASSCTPAECGPRPAIATQPCPDGAYPAFECGWNGKTCVWSVNTCPEAGVIQADAISGGAEGGTITADH